MTENEELDLMWQNKIIADFVDLKISWSQTSFYDTDGDWDVTSVPDFLDHDIDLLYLYDCPSPYSVLKFNSSWNWIIPVGKKMEEMVFDGNWGLFEQFFSDELTYLENFKKSCYNFDIISAYKAAIDFIQSLNHQDINIVDKAKNYKHGN